MRKQHFLFHCLQISLLIILAAGYITPELMADTTQVRSPIGFPVTYSSDTLLYVYAKIGPFSPLQRAVAINQRLGEIIKHRMDPESIRVEETEELTNIVLDSLVIMSVTNEDAAALGKSRLELGGEYVSILRAAIKEVQGRHSIKAILLKVAVTFLFMAAMVFAFWVMMKVFPKGYAILESWEGIVFRSLKIRSKEIISAGSITAFFIVLLKGLRLVISLAILYYFIIYVMSLFSWTRTWNLRPVLEGLLFSVIATTAVAVILKAVNATFTALIRKIDEWRGTLIKPIKVKTVQVLSEERIVELSKLILRASKIAIIIAIAYFYITIIFSFFDFTQTWASTLIGYILTPLGKVLMSFVNYLPNLFFILVIIFVTRYVIKFIRLFFNELARGTITLPKFYREWADPTYKIVRFMVLTFAVIVIFPYLPGSSSPIFRGISIFFGVLFSLGSTSAIANMVAGLVLTYMRPFKIGERVKIADAIGDVIEKTILVTRIRTIKNVDITIPNAMVLGSHIINFSSSASERGLILHTTVTIGYSAPWRKVHQLLKDAARATEHVLENPEPFILQTSLDDFYVGYELNVFTDQPSVMAKIYSDLHQNIQDKFNEAGVEIMSPHYTGVRDGNQIAIPEDYLPKGYRSPGFKIFPMGGDFRKSEGSEQKP